MLEFILFLLCSLFAYVWFTREHLTLEEVDKKVSKLGKEVHKLDSNLKSQEKRMGAASTQAAQAQALLHSKTKV